MSDIAVGPAAQTVSRQRLQADSKVTTSLSDVRARAENVVEPLLPIEKRLIGYSFGLGIALLLILVTINHLLPVKL